MTLEVVFILSVLAIVLCIMTLISLVLLAKDINTIMHKLNATTTPQLSPTLPKRPTQSASKSRCTKCVHRLCPMQKDLTFSCKECGMYDSAYDCACMKYEFDRNGKCPYYEEDKNK